MVFMVFRAGTHIAFPLFFLAKIHFFALNYETRRRPTFDRDLGACLPAGRRGGQRARGKF